MQNAETSAGSLTAKSVFTASFFIRHSAFVLIALLALAVRVPQLGVRPMHTDEAINAYITGELLAGKAFHYDPQDRHGPALFAVAEPLARLLGAKNFSELTEPQLRLAPVIAGCATDFAVRCGRGNVRLHSLPRRRAAVRLRAAAGLLQPLFHP